MEGANSVPEELLGSYAANHRCHRPGISRPEMASAYTDMADTYDETLRPGVYNGPVLAAETAASRVDESRRASVRVMDVAAGTGRVGYELHLRGFRNMDALDPSEGMMQKLESRGLYTNKYTQFVGLGQSAVPSDTYDFVIVAGGMGEGHIPVEGLDDMIDMAKPGGEVIIVMRKEYLDYVEEYKDKLEPYMDQLSQKGKWTKVERKIVPNYSYQKDGVIFIYKVK
ncbi:demethylmenaquinone methyltransferase-like [Penaeus japonicus]|uniref:demethylmenaquinone methyltransferase-like n=1 Tax=Penaeus japonicus TaxID=27405 RepID=UPI001C70B655|nr:demethylmenaquinone methyltransferase-like [Penaeus japonicus]